MEAQEQNPLDVSKTEIHIPVCWSKNHVHLQSLVVKSHSMWRRPIFCRTILVVAFAFCVITARSQERDNPKFSSQAESKAKNLKQQIQAEIGQFKAHEWAGEYREGDGLGVNISLIIAPKSGCLFEWHGCVGLYDRNYGAVTNVNGTLRLSFTFENHRKGFQGIAEEFTLVKWGKRSYLIPSDDVIGFCNAVNSASEPREAQLGRYLLRQGDEKIKAAGKPTVPAEYRAYLLKSPVNAEIVKVGPPTTRPSVSDWKFKDTPVTLNVGKNSGLLPGMELDVIHPDFVVESVKIKSVRENDAEGIMTQIGEESVGPKVGWKLSTLPRWREKASR